jgi:gluconate 2-dehydrogenase gamma chain
MGPSILGAKRGEVLAAALRRLIPSDQLGPGAEEAGVARFIENELRGTLRPLVGDYQEGLERLDRHALETAGRGFAELSPGEQDEVLEGIESIGPGGEEAPLREFFELLLGHCIDGFFSDPLHGGNADLVGWRLVGYPGVNLTPTVADQELDRQVEFHGTTLESFPDFNPVRHR